MAIFVEQYSYFLVNSHKMAAPWQHDGSSFSYCFTFPAMQMTRTDCKHLQDLAVEKPKTKAGLIRMLWPEIKRALNAGHTVKEIELALKQDGIEINYSNLRYCVAFLKRKDLAEASSSASHSVQREIDSGSVAVDAGAALQEQRAKKIKFDHNPFSTRIKELI